MALFTFSNTYIAYAGGMSSTSAPRERRATPRFDGQELAITVRQKGRINRIASQAVDFSRFGVAVLTNEPLDKHKPVFISLRCGALRLENVVGVVHNCLAQDGQYRCGIQFRTQSTLQFDKTQVERTLLGLEACLGAPLQAASGG